jgi:hypothetical protein
LVLRSYHLPFVIKKIASQLEIRKMNDMFNVMIATNCAMAHFASNYTVNNKQEFHDFMMKTAWSKGHYRFFKMRSKFMMIGADIDFLKN